MKQTDLLVHTLYAAIPKEVIILDRSGTILYMNQSAQAYVDCPTDQAIGRSVDDFFPGLLSSLGQADCPHHFFEVKPFSYAEHTYILCMAKDTPDSRQLEHELPASRTAHRQDFALADRRRFEQELRQSEERYRLIAENVLDLIRTVDKDGVILYASPSHERVLGYSPDTLLGKPCFSIIHPDDREQARSSFLEMVRTKQPTPFYEYRFDSADGSRHVFEVRGIPLLTEKQEVEKVIVFGRDISERRKTEELLRHSDKLSVLGELAAGIAHEIRNPLTALRGFIQLLQAESIEKKSYLEVMIAEIDRINFIASELLLLAKPQVLHFKRYDLYSLLYSVIKLLEPQTNMDNIRIRLTLHAPIPYINCEEKQIKQVFINLIKNAIEAMSQGGDIFLSISLPDKEHVLIQVIDEGCGIPSELISRLGDPFYSTKEKGTGLGMMISQKIIKEHRGQMTIQSQVGKGTVVSIVLPTVP